LNRKLWYKSPAKEWKEGLPVGNGRLAGMVIGDPYTERIALNHEWLWRGNHRYKDNETQFHRLPKVRELLLNGKDSYKDFGILIEKRPNVPSPKRRVSYISIPGRNSSLRYDEETYEDITLSVECAVIGNIQSKIDDIKAWLIGSGESDLIFSFQSDKKYIAQVVNSIDFEVILKITSRFVIIFNCRPFKYSVMNEVINITSGTGTSVLNRD
jgi:predicted phage tail component-like protein